MILQTGAANDHLHVAGSNTGQVTIQPMHHAKKAARGRACAAAVHERLHFTELCTTQCLKLLPAVTLLDLFTSSAAPSR